jgi:hypothetical protein
MKKNLFLALFLFLAVVALSACDDDKSGGSGQKLTAEQFQQRLDIGSAEAQQVETIYTEQVEKMKSLMEASRSKGPGAMMSGRSEMENIKNGAETKLSAFLTTDQIKEYNKIMEEQMEKNRPSGGRGGSGGGMGGPRGGMGGPGGMGGGPGF